MMVAWMKHVQDRKLPRSYTLKSKKEVGVDVQIPMKSSHKNSINISFGSSVPLIRKSIEKIVRLKS
jgi:hypothetical protein